MLNHKQKDLYDRFYESTHENEHLDRKTEILIGLAAAMGMNCAPCTRYYLEQAKTSGVSKGELSELLAKVMAVAAGQKRLQAQDVLDRHDINLDDFS